MKEQDPSLAEAERRLKEIASESEKQQDAKVRSWLDLAQVFLDSEPRTPEPHATNVHESQKKDDQLEEELTA